jgi:hypothetical protein
MLRLRPASAIATLSLLAWAATASAECAWVLWVESRSVQGPVRGLSEWDVKDGYDTRSDCVKGLDAVEKEWRGQVTPDTKWRPMRFNEIQFTLLPLPGGYWHTDYRCLPSGVDPRGLKGK